uniref:Uncharacterized protein n=1 Tax=Anopheles maculatus TaxID=74869 RepID=A0A182S939_9DIPT
MAAAPLWPTAPPNALPVATTTTTTHSPTVTAPPAPPPPSSHHPSPITTSPNVSSTQQPSLVAHDHIPSPLSQPNSALASVFGAMQQHIPAAAGSAQPPQPLPTFSPARSILQHIQQQPTAFRSE